MFTQDGQAPCAYFCFVYVMRIPSVSLPSDPTLYIEKTRVLGSLMTEVVFIFETSPVMSGPSIQPVMVFVAASYVLSDIEMPDDIESVQLPTYFFLAGS